MPISELKSNVIEKPQSRPWPKVGFFLAEELVMENQEGKQFSSLLEQGDNKDLKALIAQERRKRYFKIPWYAYVLISVQALLLADGIFAWFGHGLLWPWIISR
jgi:hypothetical protein